MNVFENIKNLFGGNITIHQEIINKVIKEALADNKTITDIALSFNEGFLAVAVDILADDSTPVSLKLELELGKFEFNRTNRVIELILISPVTIMVYGITIKAKLTADIDIAAAKIAGAPVDLIDMFSYLAINENSFILDFNQMPGFNQALQNKLGFLLNNLEITELELQNENLVIHPSIKFF
ncbi:MAG: hypothetical protein BWY65_00345 [Firmicutes bacterium ADurb.Bin373]|nr:hypothetical protein [Bacillota bacterium]OQA10865.1 MAG: hypothetical protein BWY65_00345 [Firmicutes bacterium ADurb.Bin373]